MRQRTHQSHSVAKLGGWGCTRLQSTPSSTSIKLHLSTIDVTFVSCLDMVRAWYMKNVCGDADQRLEHHRTPQEFVTKDHLYQASGVECFQFADTDNYKHNEELKRLKLDRGYTYEDELVCSKQCLPNYNEKIKMFFQEHLHTDEEIRYILDGSGYFDVRDRNDQWIRIECTAGDLIVLPKGIYHRFTLDTKNYIKAKRYFVGEPVWTCHNRPADDLPCRQDYITFLQQL